MRTLTVNELQFVSGGDLPAAPDVYSTAEILSTLEDNPVPVGTVLAVAEVYYNFAAAVQFGLTALVWGVYQATC